MHEYIEIKFRKNGAWLKVKREAPGGGLELDEPDPIARTVAIGFSGANEITNYRMRRIRQIKGWRPGEFKLRPAIEDNLLVLRGDDKHSLPEGRYTLRIGLEEAKTKQPKTVTLEHDKHAQHIVDVTLDDRTVRADVTSTDAEIQRVLAASDFDGQDGYAWLADARWRATKKACLLNLLASLRTRPTRSDSLIEYIEGFFWISNDRAYARVHRDLLARLEDLAADDKGRFYREGTPRADVHRRLLNEIPDAEKPSFPTDCLVSFRGEGRPSLQTVIAKPPVGFAYTYAEFDLDLGNPLQDLGGFVVHLVELADGRQTNHLDLRAELSKTGARDFLYYTVRHA